jgi:hypothetical protein
MGAFPISRTLLSRRVAARKSKITKGLSKRFTRSPSNSVTEAQIAKENNE